MQRLFTWGNLLWLGAYATLVVAICWAMLSARSWAIDSLSAASATKNWQDFRTDAARISEKGPVKRRVPPSSEPPTLRLLRDHFPASLSAALFFSSAVFVTFMLLLRGTFQRVASHSRVRFADEESAHKSRNR